MRQFMGKINGKAIIFSFHVFKRSRQRKIPVGVIKKVIADPQITYKTQQGTLHLESKIKGRRTVVIMAEYKKHYVIVSCW